MTSGNMFPTKGFMPYELSETILLFGLRYLHLDSFQFLIPPFNSLHVQFFVGRAKNKRNGKSPTFLVTVNIPEMNFADILPSSSVCD